MKIGRGTRTAEEIEALDLRNTDKLVDTIIHWEQNLELRTYFEPPATYVQYLPKVRVYREAVAAEYEAVPFGPWLRVKT